MPRRNKEKPKTIDEVTEEMETTGEELPNLLSDSEEKPEKVEPQTKTDEDSLDKKRNILMKLAEDGDLDKSVAYIKKASQKVINNLYTEYERKRMQK